MQINNMDIVSYIRTARHYGLQFQGSESALTSGYVVEVDRARFKSYAGILLAKLNRIQSKPYTDTPQQSPKKYEIGDAPTYRMPEERKDKKIPINPLVLDATNILIAIEYEATHGESAILSNRFLPPEANRQRVLLEKLQMLVDEEIELMDNEDSPEQPISQSRNEA